MDTKITRWAQLFNFENQKKGDDLVKKALKLERKSTFGSLFGFVPTKEENYQNAANFYIEAAHAYKLDENCLKQAAFAFMEAYALLETIDAPGTQVVKYCLEAVKCLREAKEYKSAIILLTASADKYQNYGLFGSAANCLMEVAEILEQENKLDACHKSYLEAKKLYKTDGNLPAKCNNCVIKIANLHLQTNKYSEAASCFDEVATELTKHELGLFGAKKEFLMAFFCYMAANTNFEFICKEVDKHNALDKTFNSSIEYRFIDQFVEVYKTGDVDQFAEICAEYDSLFPATPTLTNIWLQIKSNLESKENKIFS
jgi:tetratricopeptide (TPR) repeat protein